MKNMNTDTPETDYAARHIDGFADQWVPRYVSEELERERDEARVLADRLAEAIRKHQVELPFRADFCDVELYEALAAWKEAAVNPEPMETMNTPSPKNDQPTYAMLADMRDRALLAERERDELRRTNEGLQLTFDLRWKADQRAIKRWQAAHPGNDLTWPDHSDMVVWLMEQTRNEELERERDEAREALKTGGLLDILDRAGHDRAEAVRERDEANIKLDLARVRADEAIGDAAACSRSFESLETPLTDKYVSERNFMGYNIAPDDVAFMRAVEQTYGKWRNRCSTAEASLKTLNLWKP